MPDNCAPFGYVTHSPDQPQTNKSITFDASYSYDLDGTVQNYQWDWNQDGTYDSTGVSATHTDRSDRSCRPSAPTSVVTNGRPAAIVSISFSLTPDPNRIGTRWTRTRLSHTAGSGA